MSMLTKHFRNFSALWLVAVLAGGMIMTRPAQAADVMTINLDHAEVLLLPDRVATIVIGNPLIADASLQTGGMLVVTGKGYGATNLLALDRGGRVLLSKTIQVLSAGTEDIVVVYKGVERESYSCAPLCQRRVTLGDSDTYFNSAMSQAGSLSSSASGSAGAGAKTN